MSSRPLDHLEVLARLDWERKHVALGGETLEAAGDVVRMCAPDGSHHVIIWSQLNFEHADAVIDREIAWHRKLGVSFEWKVYAHDQPSDLRDRLVARGFEIGERENVMVMGIEQARQRAADTGRKANPNARVECARSADQIEVFKRVAEEVFGGDWSYTAAQLSIAIENNDPGHRGYIAYLDDQPVSIGRLYVHARSAFAGLYGGGTRPAFRGKGLYKAVVEARITDAIEWGAMYLMVDARDTSRGILERMGFESVGETWPCVLGE